MQTTKISLVRHGQVYNPQQIYYGRLPRFRLSVKGRAQAAQAAQHLSGQEVTAVYTSPLLRARQTAKIIATTLNLPLHQTRSLLEVYTPHDGRPIAELDELNWDIYTGSPFEYEQPVDIVKRMSRFIKSIRRKQVGGHTVLVSHGDTIAWTVLWATDKPLTLEGRQRLQKVGLPVNYPTYACVLSLSFAVSGQRPYAITYHGASG